jgi:molybdopterin-biosynthesis enzyme MoeA-like protein
LFETLTAEIIAIGSELLAPDRTDTNSLWLTEQLNRLGIEVKLKTIVGDDNNRLEEAIKDRRPWSHRRRHHQKDNCTGTRTQVIAG